MMEVSVNSLGLSVRATNSLKRMGVLTLDKLVNTPIEEIENTKNVGAKTVEEIKDFVHRYEKGQVDIDAIVDNKEQNIKNYLRVFTEDELEVMSHFSILDLQLSTRPENAVLRMGCNKISDLAVIPEKKLRELKGLGKKSCDEIIQKFSSWVAENVQSISTDNEDVVSDSEKSFYLHLSEMLAPIKWIYWRQLRELVIKNNEDISLDIDDNRLIAQILKYDEFTSYIKIFFLDIAPDGIMSNEKLQSKLTELNLQFDKNIIIECMLDLDDFVQTDEVFFIKRPKLMQYLLEHESAYKERDFDMLIRRLNGESLQDIGESYELSRERVRQITAKTASKNPIFYEDYFRYPYEYFKFSKYEFYNAFPECGETGYEYLSIKYKKGNVIIDEESVSGYSGIFNKKIKRFWEEESLKKDKMHVTRTKMLYRVLLSNSDRAMSMEDFEHEYYSYLERRNYPKERLSINIRSVSNHFRNAPYIVFNRDNCVRYCEADAKRIWNTIDFDKYKDLVISAELIYRDYIDLMEELDIRDGYELFYIIKSSLNYWDNSKYEINCRRVPVMIIGNGDESRQALQLLKENSPIDFSSYYEAYEERFGVRTAAGNPVISGALANYYIDGVFSIDVIAIDEEDIQVLKESLSQKSFWFIDEVEKIFHEICVHSSDDAFNKAAFKRIGYSLNIGYLYDDNYGSVFNYFDQEIFSKPIIDFNDYDQRLWGLSVFKSALYKKRMDLEYIEVAPKVFMSISELERVYGLSIEDVHELQRWICSYNQKFFNAHSVWNELQSAGLTAKLQDNEWLCTCIFRQQPIIYSQQVAGGIILCKEDNELNFGTICQWLVKNCGKMTVQGLTAKFNDTFATRVPVSKIAERLKSQGVWDSLVTDSFDEYIDNLVASTSVDMDIDDLLKEEFF